METFHTLAPADEDRVEVAVGPVELQQLELRGWSSVRTVHTTARALHWARQHRPPSPRSSPALFAVSTGPLLGGFVALLVARRLRSRAP